MNYVQIFIGATERKQEELIASLNEMNAIGFEQTDLHLTAYFDEENYHIKRVGNALKKCTYSIQILEAQDWNALWESNFDSVVVGEFCAVRAHFHQSISQVLHQIIITPKMSFGTGHHATTYMMIEQMQRIDFKDKIVLDFGTGSGILAILAEKLGGSQITAIDIDLWSIENTKENIEKNDCRNIDAIHSSTIPWKQYDVVLANINKNIILDYLKELKTCTSKNGYLVFSGLLEFDEYEIGEACLKQGLNFVEKKINSNWILLTFMNSIHDVL